MWEGLTAEDLRISFPNDFWIEFLQYIIDNNIEEDQFWDYKEYFTVSKKAPRRERDKVVHEIAKDFSSFANAESGLLIYGITDIIPRKIVGVINPERKVQQILDFLKNTCNPELKVFPLLINVLINNRKSICVVFLIPKSSDPIAVKNPINKYPEFFYREGPRSRALQSVKGIGKLFEAKKKIKLDSFPVLDVIRNLLSYPKSIPISDDVMAQYRNSDPLTEEDHILSNYIPLKVPPRIWTAPLSENALENSINLELAPPFILKEGRIFSLMDFRKEEYLMDFVEDTDSEFLLTKNWILDYGKYQRYMVELLNAWVSSLLQAKGLLKCPRTYAHYFVASQNKRITWFPGKRKSTRTVVKFYYKKDMPEILNFVKNEAANVFVMLLDKVPFLVILRRLFFTKDGYIPEEGDITKRLIDSFSRDPKKSYNSNQRLHFLFWYNFIASKSGQIPLDSNTLEVSSHNFRDNAINTLLRLVEVGKPVRLQVNWKPNSEGEVAKYNLEKWLTRF